MWDYMDTSILRRLIHPTGYETHLFLIILRMNLFSKYVGFGTYGIRYLWRRYLIREKGLEFLEVL